MLDSLHPEEWVRSEPIFVETTDDFVFSAEARAILAAMDAADRLLQATPGALAESPEPVGCTDCRDRADLHVRAEPPTAADLPVLDRVSALREQMAMLAADLPAAVREWEPYEVLDAVQVLQETTNVLGVCDQTVVAEIERRPDTIERTGARSTAAWLAATLRIRPSEAKRRVATANGCGPRVALTGPPGPPLPPLRPHVAAAQTAGAITVDHAHVIDRALHALPVGLSTATLDAVEKSLVREALQSNPTDVATLGRDLREWFDPDGPEPRDQQARRRRDLRLTQHDNGTGLLRGTLTAGLLAKLQTVLSPLAAPRPADANGDDTRSPGQRLHDALDDVCDRLLRSGTLPDAGGVPTTLCVTITVQDLEQRTGRVHTSHGGDMSAEELLHLAAEAEIIPVVLDDTGGILCYGQTRRVATPAQTKALIARDRHCTFPQCRIPPEWCQRHHILAWLLGGLTAIANLALLCGYHHRNHEKWGWTCQMIDGIPHWTPPPDLDPDQKPLQNVGV